MCYLVYVSLMQMLKSRKKHHKKVLILGICKHKHKLEHYHKDFYTCLDCGHLVEWQNLTWSITNGLLSSPK